MKVGDLIQSSAFEGQRGIIIRTDHVGDVDGSWYYIVWFRVNRAYALSHNKDWNHYEWCRKDEFELVDIS